MAVDVNLLEDARAFVAIHDVSSFVATLRFPKFASYVVGQLRRHYSLDREEAVAVWEVLKAGASS